MSYSDLETLVDAVSVLQQCRSGLAMSRERGAPEDQLRQMRLAVFTAEKSVEGAADLLADSEERRARARAP